MSARETVLVVGAGMVGTRFADDLVRRDRSRRYDVHLLGEEQHLPYNRILLSDVLAGRASLASLALPLPDAQRVTLSTGSCVEAVDVAGRTVRVRGGLLLGWDRLVLATGSRPRVPAVPGLDAGLPRGAYVLRTLDDCRDIAARALNARRAVVVGAGVLGVEMACGLRRRGVAVTLVHGARTVMDRQLDAAAADVLRLGLGDLGIDVRTGSPLGEVLLEDDRVAGVRLVDGAHVDGDVLLLACGVEPETALARRAGIAVDGGITVDATGTSPTDPRVYAIGDCVAASRGLLAPGWQQSDRLAAHLVDAAPGESGAELDPAPVRLKAAGLEVVTMGLRASTAPAGHRVVALSDPTGRRHAEVVVDGDRLAGATCVGWPEVAATVQSAYERHAPLPLDPVLLLVSGNPPAAAAAASPTAMPAGTTVCRCNGVTKREVVTAAETGTGTIDDVAGRTRATTGCGSCRDLVEGLCSWVRTSQSSGQGREAEVSPAKHVRTVTDIAPA